MHVSGLLARPLLRETASRSRRWAARRTLIFACCALSLRLVPGLALPMAAAAHRSHSSRDGGSSDYEAGAVPSYMLDLYQRYVSGAPPLDGSNTVHCIHATRSRTWSGDSDALEFDLETIGGGEALVRAELRLSDGRAGVRDPAAAAAASAQPLVLSMRVARRRTDSQAEATAASAALPGGPEEAVELPRPLWTTTLAQTPIALRSRGFGGGWVNVGGWRMIEVTHPIKRALLSAAGKIELLAAYPTAVVDESASAEPEAGKSVGVTEARTGEDGRSSRDGNSSSRGLDLLISRHGLPYLLVYTNDTVNLTADQISSRLRLRDSDNIRQEADSLVNPETGLLGSEDLTAAAVARRKRPSAAAAPSALSSSSSAAPSFSSAAIESWWHAGKPARRLPKRILRRDVADDNEIPGDPDVARRLRLPQQSSVASQQLRHPRPAVPAKTPATNLGDILMPRSPGRFRSLTVKPQRSGSSGQLIPWPKESDKLPFYARRRQSGSKQDGDAGGDRSASGGRRTERQRQKQLKQTSRAAGVPAASSGASCGRKRLTLDFEDVGWGGWIIEPKSFDIHYCAGACEFPLNSAQQPTNHATIQSLLRAAGVRPDLPAPCCVPDKLSSVTLLYFDQRRNVVLKSYPGMTVESCACR